MSTKAQIRQRVAEDLALVAVGQAPESQDQARIDATFDEVYARLKAKGLATWASTADVPTSLVPYYALMMEVKLLTSYSVSEARYQRILIDAGTDGMTALEKLAELALPMYESGEDEADF